ncbi:MAG: hypothetical protein J5I92_01780 [Thiogranum sp.]|nr:hypothetical protein [Thiogranum sp.]
MRLARGIAARLMLALLVMLPLAAPAANEEGMARILFVASQRSASYTEFITHVQQTLDTGNPRMPGNDTLFADDLSASPAPDPQQDLVVAMGTRAAQALQEWQPRTPVIYTLIPEMTFEELRQSGRLPCHEDRCTAIYIDQPLERQVRILHAAFGHRRIGVLLGPTSQRYRGPLEDATRRYKLSTATAAIEDAEGLLPALQNMLEQVDVLLALPDPLVYNSRTAQSILLTTYRYKVPLVAFSKAYTDAGATLSVYSTPRQMATQTAAIIREFLHGERKQLPAPAYPERFRVQINRHVARSIGLDFADTPEFLSIMKESNDE